MNKTKFLAALAIPALLAACSQDEFTENTQSKNVDLSNRKAIENVVLSFGENDANTRAGIGTTAYNSYAWTAEDGVGACIIDHLNGVDLEIVDYISSNYKYYYTDNNQWKTDALMVEGNYMFYAPYNEKHLVRSNITASIPTTQNVKVQKEDNNAIAEFYESGNTVFAGYKMLESENQSAVINVAMRHIFAYPLITLVNKYDLREDKSKGEPQYKEVKIVKVVLKDKSSNPFDIAFIANNAHIAEKLVLAADGKNLVWDTDKHETAATTDIFDVARDKDGNAITAKEITMNLGDGITLKGEDALSFYAVLPAAAYANGISAVAYDAEGNSYSIKAKTATTGLTLNPGYRYPAQEYNEDGTLKKSAGQLLTFNLEEMNAAPTDIIDNDDFIAYLKSLTVRYNDLEQVTAGAPSIKENQFVLNENAKIIINSTLIDALSNYNYVVGATGSVTFTTDAADATFAIASDVTIEDANFNTDKVTITVVSANGKKYKVILPAASSMNQAAGTYVISSGALTIDNDQVAPTNIIIAGTGVTFDGTNAKKISSLNIVTGGELTLNGGTEGVVINNGGKLTIGADILVESKIVNTGIISNSGVMYAENNVNNGEITVETNTAVTKAAAGTGSIANTKLGAVKANATQTVTWMGALTNITGDDGLAKKGDAKYGINNVTITGTDLSADVTLALLKTPVKGCAVSTVTLSQATKLTLAEGGDMSGLTLVFDASCVWTGDNFETPEFTNAKIRVADGETVTVNYAKVSGTQVKGTGYTGTIAVGNGAEIHF